MSHQFFGLCGGCKKRRIHVANRVYQLQHPRIPVTSNNKLCGRCWKALKSLAKQNPNEPRTH